jgi:predicted HicB family RNase H-like nuclease
MDDRLYPTTIIKTFPIRLTSGFHKQIKEAAEDAHISINQFILQAITEKITEQKKNK